ncbi:MAG: FtsW/RodA/SpoVE family cell cycle protein [Verrucomicrobia bacterium]|nr:FtsW/RodA/SpoVE family cell cycle protein [Verrucomicrobiota bacterium]
MASTTFYPTKEVIQSTVKGGNFYFTPVLMLLVFGLLIVGLMLLASAHMGPGTDSSKSNNSSISELVVQPDSQPAQLTLSSPVKSIKRQIILGFIGIVLGGIAYLVPHRWMKSYTYFFLVFLGIMAMLASVYVFPAKQQNSVRSVKRWTQIPMTSATFQPSEAAKLGLVMMIATWAYVNPQRIKNLFHHRGLLPLGLMVATILGMIFAEPDYATTLVCGVISLVCMYIGGASLRWVMIFLVLLSLLVGITVTSFVKNRSERIESWKNLWSTEYVEVNRQQLLSINGIARGGLFGTGLGMGISKFGRLSEHDSDFIIAVVAEELGFLGILAVLSCFFFILYAGSVISIRSRDLFGRVLAMGIVTMISTQVLLNIATATALVPNTGLTFPFFSNGGTSLVLILVAIGFLMGVEREARAPIIQSPSQNPFD